LLRSHPGGFSGAGCLGLAVANIEIKNENEKGTGNKDPKISLKTGNLLIFKLIFFNNR